MNRKKRISVGENSFSSILVEIYVVPQIKIVKKARMWAFAILCSAVDFISLPIWYLLLSDLAAGFQILF
jgi:hypothetical protein